jgi:triosephosphate isomerase
MFSGLVKMIDPRGTEYKIKDYAVAFGMDDMFVLYMPLAFSILLALFEFNIGISLLFGTNRRWVSRAMLVFFLIFTPFTLYLAFTNPVHDCGCFGDAVMLTNWQTFYKNLVLLLCALVLFFGYRRQTRLISEHNQWLVSLYTWVFSFILTLYCIYTLPVIDFRPYHIGANISQKMQWDDLGKQPPITDLVITHPVTGEELTDSIISSPGWTFLIVAPRLELADDGIMDKLTELTDYCLEYDYTLVALTSSSDSLINHWRDITGAEYPFLVVDEIPLKTMVRSNPGLLLLHDGVVVNKWASSQIPGAPQLVAPLHKLSWVVREQSSYGQRGLLLFSWYLIPLLICTVLDRLWVGIKLYRERRNRI